MTGPDTFLIDNTHNRRQNELFLGVRVDSLHAQRIYTLHIVKMPRGILKISQKHSIVKEHERRRLHGQPITDKSLAEWAEGEYSLSELPTKKFMFQIYTVLKMAEENENTVEMGRALYKRHYAKHVILERALYEWIYNLCNSRRCTLGNLIKSKALELSKMSNERLPAKKQITYSLQKASPTILKRGAVLER